MGKIMAKIDLKDRTALRHINTVEKASERVSSWPSWKRDVTFFRDSDEEELSIRTTSDAGENVDEGSVSESMLRKTA
jgi:hypothetical protein